MICCAHHGSHVTRVHINPLHPRLHSLYSRCRSKFLLFFKLISSSFADTTNPGTWQAGGDRSCLETAICFSCHYHLPGNGQDPVSSASSGWSRYLGICTSHSLPAPPAIWQPQDHLPWEEASLPCRTYHRPKPVQQARHGK